MTTNDDLRRLLGDIRTIAIVGFSPNPARPSNEVARFLVSRGYDCIGVNPGIAGQRIADIPVVATLADAARSLNRPVDMVDIFRASDAVGGVVDDALALGPRPILVWMQLGVVDAAAKARAETAGLRVVMDHCPKIVLSQP